MPPPPARRLQQRGMASVHVRPQSLGLCRPTRRTASSDPGDRLLDRAAHPGARVSATRGAARWLPPHGV
jgi:hypothetical protein